MAAYAATLKLLARRAYPKYKEVASGDVELTHFLNGIECGRKVRNKEPKNGCCYHYGNDK